jgi:hypothetical protein
MSILVFELCCSKGFERVDIWSLRNEPLENCYLATWLKENLESPGKQRKTVESGDKSLEATL